MASETVDLGSTVTYSTPRTVALTIEPKPFSVNFMTEKNLVSDPALIFRSLLNSCNSWYTGNTLLLAFFVHRLFSQGDCSWCAERKEVLQPVTWVVAVPRCSALPSPVDELQSPLTSTPCALWTGLEAKD